MQIDYVYLMKSDGDEMRHMMNLWYSELALKALGRAEAVGDMGPSTKETSDENHVARHGGAAARSRPAWTGRSGASW